MSRALTLSVSIRVALRRSTSSNQNSIAPTWQCLRGDCPVRSFSSRGALYGKKKNAKQEPSQTVQKAISRVQAAGTTDPKDFSQMDQEISQAQDSMQNTLSTLRAGGRFNHELLENLKVDLKDSKQQVRLGDLAQVIPKSGRQITIIVGEQDRVKAVSSTIQRSPYSLNPTPSPNNALELQLAIPPPTAESRKRVLVEADQAAEKTNNAVRQARAAQQKRLNAMEKSKAAHVDDIQKARQAMEKVIEGANKKSKEMLDKAKKALEG